VSAHVPNTNAKEELFTSTLRRRLHVLTSKIEDPQAPPRKKEEDACQDFINLAMEEGFTGVNIYDIYANVCLPQAQARMRQMALLLRDHPGGLAFLPALARTFLSFLPPVLAFSNVTE